MFNFFDSELSIFTWNWLRMIKEGMNIQILQNSSSKSHFGATAFRTNRQEKENAYYQDPTVETGTRLSYANSHCGNCTRLSYARATKIAKRDSLDIIIQRLILFLECHSRTLCPSNTSTTKLYEARLFNGMSRGYDMCPISY